MQVSNPSSSQKAETAHIGKSVLVKGELSGSEDLYVDGEVEGRIELRGHNLVIGPNGRVRASIHAREVVIHGKVAGNIEGVERVVFKNTANVVGDVVTQRVAIDDGAYFKGGIDIQKPATEAKDAVKDAASERKPESTGAPVAASAAAVAVQGAAPDSK